MNQPLIPEPNTALTVMEPPKDKEVAISIPDRQVTDREAVDAMRRAGNVNVTEHYLEDLEAIGIYARKGTLKLQRGKAMINQHRLETILANAAEKLEKCQIKTSGKKATVKDGEVQITASEYAKLVQAVGAISGSLTDSQRFMVEMEEVYRSPASPKDPDQQNTSFVPGARVIPAGSTQVVAQNVHFHGNQPLPEPPQK